MLMNIEQEIKAYESVKRKEYYQEWYKKNKESRNIKRRKNPDHSIPRKTRTKEDIPILGQRIKELRLNKNMLQTELGKLLGLGSTAVGSYELGEKEPKIRTLILLSKIFNVTIDYLVGNEN